MAETLCGREIAYAASHLVDPQELHAGKSPVRPGFTQDNLGGPEYLKLERNLVGDALRQDQPVQQRWMHGCNRRRPAGSVAGKRSSPAEPVTSRHAFQAI